MNTKGAEAGKNVSRKVKELADDAEAGPSKSKKIKERILHCSAVSCQNNSDNRLMFIVPKDPSLRRQWVQSVNCPEWEPSNDSALCEIHFASDCWEQDPLGGRSLKPTAVPTEYLTGDAWTVGSSSVKTPGVGVVSSGVSGWAEQQDDDTMDIEEHDLFIKQEYLEPEMIVKEEVDQEATEEAVQGFETVFVDAGAIKDDDTQVTPNIKLEVEDDLPYDSDCNSESSSLSDYMTETPEPEIVLSSAMSCSSAPTVSVITTFPSSMTTTTVSTVTGSISTVPMPSIMSSPVTNKENNSTRTQPLLILPQQQIKNKLTLPPKQNASHSTTAVPSLPPVSRGLEEMVSQRVRPSAPIGSYKKKTKVPVKSSTTPLPGQAIPSSNLPLISPSPTDTDQPHQSSTTGSNLLSLFHQCYFESDLKIQINLAPLHPKLRMGIKVKLKCVLETIILKRIHPYDMVIAFKQKKTVPVTSING